MRPGSLTRAPASPPGRAGGSPFPYARVLTTRSPAATPAWTVSSMRPATVATCLVTTLLATLGLTRDGVRLAVEAALAAADDALGAGAHLAGLGLAATLEAAQGDAAARRQRLDDVGGDGGDAVTRLQDGADVDEAGTLGDVAALLGRRLGGGRVGLGGVARLVLRGGARTTTGGLRRRLTSGRTRAVLREARSGGLARGALGEALCLAAVPLLVVVLVVVAILGGQPLSVCFPG